MRQHRCLLEKLDWHDTAQYADRCRPCPGRDCCEYRDVPDAPPQVDPMKVCLCECKPPHDPHAQPDRAETATTEEIVLHRHTGMMLGDDVAKFDLPGRWVECNCSNKTTERVATLKRREGE